MGFFFQSGRDPSSLVETRTKHIKAENHSSDSMLSLHNAWFQGADEGCRTTSLKNAQKPWCWERAPLLSHSHLLLRCTTEITVATGQSYKEDLSTPSSNWSCNIFVGRSPLPTPFPAPEGSESDVLLTCQLTAGTLGAQQEPATWVQYKQLS